MPKDHRRALAHLALIALFTLTTLLALFTVGRVGTAYAHGDTIRLTATGVVDGHPRFAATWENDKDPVDERIAGTMTATAADGSTVGPWRLVPVPGSPGGLTTEEALRPGRWSLVAEAAFPALGRGEGVVDVPVSDPRPPVTPSGASTPQVPTATAPTPSGASASQVPTATPSVRATAPASGPAARPAERPSKLRRTLGAVGAAAVSVTAVALAVRFLRRSVQS